MATETAAQKIAAAKEDYKSWVKAWEHWQATNYHDRKQQDQVFTIAIPEKRLAELRAIVERL